jgi:ArsR family transcriptional regulator
MCFQGFFNFHRSAFSSIGIFINRKGGERMPRAEENRPRNPAEGDSDFCDVSLIHEDAVRAVHAGLLPQAQREALADFFKAMADATRLGILHALSLSEMCVCDLSAVLGMSQSSVSHQLKYLKQMRLVTNRRVGRVVYYSLIDHHPGDIIRFGLDHLAEA